jgi:hypothetical protein
MMLVSSGPTQEDRLRKLHRAGIGCGMGLMLALGASVADAHHLQAVACRKDGKVIAVDGATVPERTADCKAKGGIWGSPKWVPSERAAAHGHGASAGGAKPGAAQGAASAAGGAPTLPQGSSNNVAPVFGPGGVSPPLGGTTPGGGAGGSAPAGSAGNPAPGGG